MRTDILGRNIYRGDFITYATRQSSTLTTHVGRVESNDDDGGLVVQRIDSWQQKLTRKSELPVVQVTLIAGPFTEDLHDLFNAVESGGIDAAGWQSIQAWLWGRGPLPRIGGGR